LEVKRAIVIGARECHDREAILVIEAWCAKTGRERFFNQDMVIDPYDMTTKPKKGDAVKALRELKDTVVVIACHLFGMDRQENAKWSDMRHNEDGYMYTKENHKLLDLCLERNVPLFVLGDQPIREWARIPQGLQRTFVGAVKRMGHGTEQGIWLYEKV
jgi:hypothetical protein